MFYEKYFHFRLLKKSNASASNFFLQTASASQKFNRFHIKTMASQI